MVWTLVSGRRRCVDYGQDKACVSNWGGLGCGCWAVCGDVRVRYIGLVQELWYVCSVCNLVLRGIYLAMRCLCRG
jgi:hypothetical protein